MKRLTFAATLGIVLAGCFFGGEDDTPTALVPPTTQPLDSSKKVVPGIYVADYSQLDSGIYKDLVEAELLVDSNSLFRFFLIDRNIVDFELKGSWSYAPGSLFFRRQLYGGSDGGLIIDFENWGEDDTNEVRNLTDTSFERKEWTVFRQKPYWIGYRRKSFPSMLDGEYEYSNTTPAPDSLDSNKTSTFRMKVRLAGPEYEASLYRDGVEFLREKSSWYQVGSFFVMLDYRNLEPDSLKRMPPWDSATAYSGQLFQRVRVQGDTAMELWTEGGSWGHYTRKPLP